MSENLVSRVKRLVSGGVNSIVDAVENASPETVMAEAIRDVDGAIDQVRDQLGKVVANKHLANSRLMAANEKHENLNERIELAIHEGRDDLAEAAIARQLDLEAQIPVLESAIKDASAEEADLEGYVAALRARKREMEDDLQAFQTNLADETRGGTTAVDPASNKTERKIENAEAAFNRAMRATAGLPGLMPADHHNSAKLSELENLARDNRIRERLATLKASRVADAQ